RLEADERVEVVGDADEASAAIELIVERAPDVVLLDVNLPGGGGAAVAAAVDDPSIRFLALSASDDRDDVVA
ncbi:MAG: response regulator transcription factor, partial [Actinobacteria bacterium]|nr:response regulator transcription factor [Actinomycetota bacterium]NIU66447.1 response regulator transcription factor [Actinomycetota bacterium]NIW28259.1 response regulator [Actinomycetota bacterium]